MFVDVSNSLPNWVVSANNINALKKDLISMGNIRIYDFRAQTESRSEVLRVNLVYKLMSISSNLSSWLRRAQTCAITSSTSTSTSKTRSSQSYAQTVSWEPTATQRERSARLVESLKQTTATCCHSVN